MADFSTLNQERTPRDKLNVDDAALITFNQCMNLWVFPEIERRKKEYRIDSKFNLSRAQIILDPEKRTPIIRLNREVMAEFGVKIRSGLKKLPNEVITEDETEEILNIKLTNTDSPDACHVTFLMFKEEWIIHFDYRANKRKAKVRYEAALQFLRAAKWCLDNKLERAFLDNLVNAYELLVSSRLFCISEHERRQGVPGADSSIKYSNFIILGNAKPEFAKTSNVLYPLIDAARHFNTQLDLDRDSGSELLGIADDLATKLQLDLM